ncbi:MAG: ferritin family protein [Rhodomicrobium sp.]
MTEIPDLPEIRNVTEFFAQALAIETEASERYQLLTEQMEVHNNPEAAAIFRKMAEIENEHWEVLRRRAGDMLIAGEPALFSWIGPDGPEVTEFGKVHYLMNPHQALQIAKINEERAAAWFGAIASTAKDPEIKAIAAEMAREEREHTAWVEAWLQKFPPPKEGWDGDQDPPVISD